MTLITNDDFDDFMEWLSYEPMVAFDLETTGLRWYDGARLCGVAVGADPYWFYIPFRHSLGDNVDIDRLPDLVHELENKTLLTWNGKFDLQMIVQDGFVSTPQPRWTQPKLEDVMIAAHVHFERENTYALKPLSDKYLGEESSHDEEVLSAWVKSAYAKEIREASLYGKTKESWKSAIYRAPSDMVEPYACSDVRLTWGMRDYLLPRLEYMGLDQLYYDKCNYLQEIALMELHGTVIDHERREELKTSAEERMAFLESEIEELSGGGITKPGSSHQVNRYFGRSSTRKEDLDNDEQLKADPIGGRIREYRSADKLLTSFINPYTYWSSKNNTIHPSFNVIGTHTGRMSCKDPNLMAVPRASEDARLWVTRSKEMVVARDGYVLGEFDMSQAELRVASHYGAIAISQDPQLSMKPIMQAMTYDEYNRPLVYDQKESAVWWARNAPDALLLSPMGSILMSGNDLHQETADRIGTDRSTAKRINFSAVFGIGAQKYSDTYNVPLLQSKIELNRWRAEFVEFPCLLKQKDRQATQDRYIQLETGLARRYPPGTNTYQASSNWVQGTVAEIMRFVMQEAAPKLREIGATIILQIHDSFMVEIPEGKVHEVKKIIGDEFAKFRFAPNLVSDGKAGKRWSELTKITDELPL